MKHFSKPLLLFLLSVLFFLYAAPQADAAPRKEYIIISGGVALRQWEDLRIKSDQHDRWWGNFVRPARVRMEVMRARLGPDALITWLVHRSSYERRAQEDRRPLVSFVKSVQRKVGCNLVYFETGDDVIRYINRGQSRRKYKIAHLEYYGHSNKCCWMFEYSSDIMGCSLSYLHEQDAEKIRRRAFTERPYVKSWGCHTGESMSKVWRHYLGFPMIGALGKTDYRAGYRVTLIPGGKWVQ